MLLISEFLECTALVNVVVPPRRFGKTTNLSMLKSFFAIPIAPDSKKRRLELFGNLEIWKEKKELFDEHLCKNPAISINIKV